MAVLLRGPSTSGKSDLALRLIDGGARLVADDQVVLVADGGTLRVSAPAEIGGLIEIRGIGLLRLDTVAEAPVGLVVALAPGVEVERLPAPQSCRIEGIELPLVTLDPFQASAAARVRQAARAVRDGTSFCGALGDQEP